MYITEESKNKISSILGGIGLIALLSGIFLHNVEFGLGLLIAAFFWLIDDIFSSWLKIDKINQKIIFKNNKAVSKIFSSLAILIIIYFIFMNGMEFGMTVIVALTLFMIAGLFSDSYGTSKPYNNRTKVYPTSFNYGSPKKQRYPDHEMYPDEGPAKMSCSKCGNSVAKSDVFCSNCGNNISV